VPCLIERHPPGAIGISHSSFQRMEKAADAVKAAAAIAQAVADGELTPGEASELSGFVANYVKALELSDLEARLQRLEAVNREGSA
jgi:hypothetical protein